MRAIAPATIANLGAGFDVFGLSVDAGRDEVEAHERARGIEIRVEGHDVPLDPARNTAGLAAHAILPRGAGVLLRIRKGIRPASGLGSSAASAAAAVVAIDRLFDLGLSRDELVAAAARGEPGGHADNVAAAICGGFTIAHDGRVRCLAPPPSLALAIKLPRAELRTEDGRRILPRDVPLHAMTRSTGAAAAFVAALLNGDLAEAGRVAEGSLVDRAREPLIAGFADVRRAARQAGAYGVFIAGSGPAIAALVDDRSAHRVARAMGPDAFVTRPTGGARVEVP